MAWKANALPMYAPSDIQKLEKFLRDKTVAEREMGMQLLVEMMAYVETAACRRKTLLHYFGEDFDEEKCNDKCDNCAHPKEKIDVTKDVLLALEAVRDLKENYTGKVIISYLQGSDDQKLLDFEFDKLPRYGAGKEQDDVYWQSVFRNAILQNLIRKDVETYGVIKLTDGGRTFMEKPFQVLIALNRDFSDIPAQSDTARSMALDEPLLKMLRDLRSKNCQAEISTSLCGFSRPFIGGYGYTVSCFNGRYDKNIRCVAG